MSYSFGVPSFLIWSVHILVGIYFAWLGYNMIPSKFKLHGVILIVFGALMFSYHSHLWFNSVYNLKN